jgi:DeoR/GlpR family transcriptional regulator of sugar metabolism
MQNMATIKRTKTPSGIIADIIRAAMAAKNMNCDKLADISKISRTTIYRDLNAPEGMTLDRLWLYFVALEIPTEKALRSFADSFVEELVRR